MLLITSSIGRVWAEFITSGLKLVAIIAEGGRHEGVVRVFQDAIPIFVTSPGGLTAVSEHQDFAALMKMLLAVDSSMLAMANKLIKVRVRVEDMLTEAITTHMLHGTGVVSAFSNTNAPTATRTQLVEFWMRALCGTPEWYSTDLPRRLVNVVCTAAFLEDDSRGTVQSLLEHHHTVAVGWAGDRRKDERKGIGGVYHWLTNSLQYDGDLMSFTDGNNGYNFSMIRKWLANSVLPSEAHKATESSSKVCASLAFETLLMETRKEHKTRKMLAAMLLSTANKVKVTPETAAKALKQHLESFRIYKWAHYCCTLEPSQPLLPLFWQMFFSLYFESAVDAGPQGSSPGPKGSKFGHLMFEGPRELIKQHLRMQLDLNIDWHREQERSNQQGSSPSDSTTNHNLQLIDLYTAMKSWLSSARAIPHTLQSGVDLRRTSDRSLYEPADSWLCSAAYDVAWKTENSHMLWRHFVDHAAVANRLEKNHSNIALPNLQQVAGSSPQPKAKGEVLSRLLGAPTETSLPTLLPVLASCPTDCNLLSNTTQAYVNTTALIQQDLAILQDAAVAHATKFASLGVLDEDYLEALPSLYVNDSVRVTQHVVCNKLLGQPCQGAAELVFMLQQQHIVSSVQGGLSHNRHEVNGILHDFPVAEEVCRASFQTNCRIASICACCPTQANARATARVLFYSILDVMTKTDTEYSPTRAVFEWAVRMLGAAVIGNSEREMQPLLEVCVAKPYYTFLLAHLFHPNLCTEAFPQLYMAATQRSLVEPKYIEPLLECFNVQEWLTHGCPTYSNRRDMVTKLGACIEVCVNNPLPASRSECLQRMQGIHEQNLQKLLEHKFPSLYADVLNLLVDSSTRCTVPERCWSGFLDVMDSSNNNNRVHTVFTPLAPEQVSESIDWLSQQFADTRASGKCLFTVFENRIHYMSRLLLSLLRSSHTSVHQGAIPVIFGAVTQLYTPWFASTDTAGLPQVPWAQASDAAAMAHLLAELINFAQLVRPLDTTMAHVWALYKNVLTPNATSHVLSLVHATMEALPWHEFLVGPAELVAAISILDVNPNTTSHLFLASVFCKLTWTEMPPGQLSDEDQVCTNAKHAFAFGALIMRAQFKRVWLLHTAVSTNIHSAPARCLCCFRLHISRSFSKLLSSLRQTGR